MLAFIDVKSAQILASKQSSQYTHLHIIISAAPVEMLERVKKSDLVRAVGKHELKLYR